MIFSSCNDAIGYLVQSDDSLKIIAGDPVTFGCSKKSDEIYCALEFRNAVSGGCSLQLDDVPLRISDVNRRTITFRAIAPFHSAGLKALFGKLASQLGFIERLDTQAEVLQVPALLAGCCAADFTHLASHRNQIDQRTSSTQLYQSGIHASFNGAAQRVTIEMQHPFKVNDPQHQVINFADTEHGRQTGGSHGNA